MGWYHPSSLLDKIFVSSIITKGIIGALELLGGLLLFFASPKYVDLLTFGAQKEPALSLLPVGGSKLFLIAYLWTHAGIKLVAVIGLLRNQLWAYPFSLIGLSLLMLYQFYSIVFIAPSVGMVLLTVFDAGVLWLIWREYMAMRTGKQQSKLHHLLPYTPAHIYNACMETKKPTTVEEYMNTLPDNIRGVLEEVRQTIRKAAPEGIEKISYSIPALSVNGKNLVFYSAWKEHVSLYPVPEADADFQKELAPYRSGKGTVKFPANEPVPLELITKFVEFLKKEQ